MPKVLIHIVGARHTPLAVIANSPADPELRFTPNGVPVANFTVASTPRTFDRQTNEWRDGEAMFLNCSVWRQFAENVAESLSKGMRVIVNGNLKARSYEDRNGNRRTSYEIDVIEIDAASHGGVDDARDLRERAFFAPVHSRYKIYIIDEAHMVTPQGFNALLKLVEEPPPHVKFIFATTEPEKVIGTIRSRTHHYPFRLVPPAILVNYLETLCDKEGITVDHAVLPMVVRAGGGSVRDSLSVLDQLLGGADEDGVSYELAAALLGYTPDALLDQVVDAFAAGDAHEVFATIDKVMDMGQDPRRFAEDLLRRMRDLVILAAVPDAVNNRLIDVSPEQGERLAHQAAAMGAGELTRAAEVLATGLTRMRGTTAPRLHLELMCSRILLPDADTDERGVHARLDRLERRVGIVGAGAAGSGDLVEVESSHDETAQHQRWPSGERPARPGRPASAPQGADPGRGESTADGGPAPATARQGSQSGARTMPSSDPAERPRRPRPDCRCCQGHRRSVYSSRLFPVGRRDS